MSGKRPYDLGGGTSPAELHGQLGRQLRKIYDGLARTPLPPRFVKLLEEIAIRESRA